VTLLNFRNNSSSKIEPWKGHSAVCLLFGAPCRDPLYQRLLDEICMHSAATGQTIGFDGRVLQVRVVVGSKPCILCSC
jgi:hypothetical protein